MTEANIFDNSAAVDNNVATIPAATTPSVDLDKLLKRLDDKDQFINQLIAENKKAREERDALVQFTGDTSTKASAVAAPATQSNTLGTLSQEDLASLVRKTMETQTEAQRAENNLREVSRVLSEHFGDADKAAQELARRAAALDTTVDVLRDAAAKSPKLFYAQLGFNLDASGKPIQNTVVAASPSRGDVNTAALSANTGANTAREGSYAWYLKQYGGPRGLAANEAAQVAMMDSALKLGDAFFD